MGVDNVLKTGGGGGGVGNELGMDINIERIEKLIGSDFFEMVMNESPRRRGDRRRIYR